MSKIPLWMVHLVSRVAALYRRIFSIHEIEESRTLQWLFGAVLLYFFLTFSQWVHSTMVAVERTREAVCWPYFQNCTDLFFLSNLPHGYSQTTFYMALFAIMLTIVYLMWKKQWVAAHALLLLLFIWKCFVGYVLSYDIMGMYDEYHLVITAALLFTAHKEYFAKLAFVLMYFLSATVKFHPGWILGTYFTSLELGVPLLPSVLTALITNSVILMQVVGCWFLLSRHKMLQRGALLYFVIFHLYSGVLVLYNYPTATLPVILILFGPLYTFQRPPISWKALAGWVLVGLLFLSQVPSWINDVDTSKITIANNRFGMWMFDSNHQCVTELSYYYKKGVRLEKSSSEVAAGSSCGAFECVTKTATYLEDGAWVRDVRRESPVSWRRCDPHERWRTQKNLCGGNIERIAMTLDHSINGSPFYRIIDEQNICTLEYELFGPNPWIKSPPEARAVGIPVKNVYRYPGQI